MVHRLLLAGRFALGAASFLAVAFGASIAEGQGWPPSGHHGYEFTAIRELVSFDPNLSTPLRLSACASGQGSVLVLIDIQYAGKNEFEPLYVVSLDGGLNFSGLNHLWVNKSSPLSTQPHAYADQFSNLYVAFEDRLDVTRTGLLLSWSRDGGRSFSDPTPVELEPNWSGLGPRVAVDDKGVVHITYRRRQLSPLRFQAIYRHSLVPADTKRGFRWFPGFNGSRAPAWPLHFSDRVLVSRARFDGDSGDIAVDPSGRVFATYVDLQSAPAVWLARYDGDRFRDRVAVAPALPYSLESYLMRARTGALFLAITGNDPITGRSDLFFVTSADEGKTFSPPFNLTNNFFADGPPTGQRMIALDASDNILITYHYGEGTGWSDFAIYRSEDGGQHFTARARVPPGLPKSEKYVITYALAPDGTLHLFWTDPSVQKLGERAIWYSRGERR